MGDNNKGLLAAARRGLVDAAGVELHDDEGVRAAWALVVAAQTEIALDASGGSKATTAARFVAQAAGLMDDDGDTQEEILALSVEDSERIQEMIDAYRGETDESTNPTD